MGGSVFLSFHLSSNTPQVCAPGLISNTFLWSPQRSSPGCLAADWTGACSQCQNGTGASAGVCIITADQLHLTFEQNLLDLSGQQRHGFMMGTDTQSWATTPQTPEGNYAASFTYSSSPQNYVLLPPFTMGGTAMTICTYFRLNTIENYERHHGFLQRPR